MSQSFAYVGCRTTKERDARGLGIGVYEIDSRTGAWRFKGICPAGSNPSYLLISEKHKRMYVVHGDGESVSAFRINPWSGMPEFEETIGCFGNNPVHLCFDDDEKNVFIANYASGNLAKINLDDQGRINNANVLAELPAINGPHKVEQKSSHPHFIGRIANNGYNTNWYVIPDKGSDTLYAAEIESGVVKQIISGKSRESAAPRHAVMHPFRSIIYTVNELDSTVTTWLFDPDARQITPVHTISVIPAHRHALTRASGIAITSDGEMIYVSNRGDSSIALVRIDPMTGLPSSVSWVSSQGEFPRFLCLSNDEKYLYVANEKSDSIIQFIINSDKSLIPTGQVIETGSPVCLAFINLTF